MTSLSKNEVSVYTDKNSVVVLDGKMPILMSKELNNLCKLLFSFVNKRMSMFNLEDFFSNPQNFKEIYEDLKRRLKQRDFERKSYDKHILNLQKELENLNLIYEKVLDENYVVSADKQQIDLRLIEMEYFMKDLMNSNEKKLNEISLLKAEVDNLQRTTSELKSHKSQLIIEQKKIYDENSYLKSELLRATKDFQNFSIILENKDKEISELNKKLSTKMSLHSTYASENSSLSSNLDPNDLSIENVKIPGLSHNAKPFYGYHCSR
jgi:chromosome segregation ATPase